MSWLDDMAIEKRLDKMKPKIDKLAKKFLPKVRKSEMARKRGTSEKVLKISQSIPD